MKAAIYARVSTVDQHCEMQLTELRDFCQRRGWEVGHEYVDKGWSGAKASRPQLDKLLHDAAEHRFDVLLVWKLDRFGRSVMHLSQQLQQLRTWGVRFIATTQSIDTDQSNPTSSLLLHILAAVAEFEREMIRERVKGGMLAAKQRGVRFGRPRVVFNRAGVVELKRAGLSERAIALKLGVGNGTVHRLLASEKPLKHPKKRAPKPR